MKASFDEHGAQIPESTPVEVPLGLRFPEPLHETIKRMVRNEISRRAEAEGFDTFEEDQDFEVEEDPELRSQYEFEEMESEARPSAEVEPDTKDDSAGTAVRTVLTENNNEPKA